MTAWAVLWAVVLGLSILAFTVLSVWVTAGGVSDIRALLDSLEAQHEDEPEERDRG